MTCAVHGGTMYEPPDYPEPRFTCPLCEIEDLREQLENLRAQHLQWLVHLKERIEVLERLQKRP